MPPDTHGLDVDQAPGDLPGSLNDKGRHAGESRLSADPKMLKVELKQERSPRQAWRLFHTIVFALRWRLSVSRQRGGARTVQPSAPTQASIPTRTPGQEGADYPLGVEIVALGERARAVFRSSRRVAHGLRGQHVDVVVADTPAESAAVEHPTVLLSKVPLQISVPAFDPWTDNPIKWASDTSNVSAALGPRGHLPQDIDVQRVIDRNDRTALREVSRLEDVHAYHKDVLSRAGELARLAANGVVVRLADCDSRLAEPLGAELYDLMTRDSQAIDSRGRELLSIRMRRAALRDHSLRSRARQVCEAIQTDPPLPPLVSILMVTRRPSYLPQAINAVARQTYPRLELVLGLHRGRIRGV